MNKKSVKPMCSQTFGLVTRLTTVCSKTLSSGAIAALVLAGPLGCATSSVNSLNFNDSSSLHAQGLQKGTLTIAKRMPGVTSTAKLPLYGFLPFSLTNESLTLPAEKNWIELNSSTGSLTVRKGASPLSKAKLLSNLLSRTNGNSLAPEASLKTAVLSVTENPTWLASDSYFLDRGLDIPEEGDSSRFLKGALGEVAIFLENGSVIHSGPFAEQVLPTRKDAFSVKSNPEALREVAKFLQAGAKVIVR